MKCYCGVDAKWVVNGVQDSLAYWYCPKNKDLIEKCMSVDIISPEIKPLEQDYVKLAKQEVDEAVRNMYRAMSIDTTFFKGGKL